MVEQPSPTDMYDKGAETWDVGLVNNSQARQTCFTGVQINMAEQKWVRVLGTLSALLGVGYFMFEILSSPLISEAAKYFSITMIIFAAFAIYVQTYFRRS